MASDAYYSPKADAFVKALNAEDAVAWDAILWDFIEDPLPSDGRAVELGVPYPPGTYGRTEGEFWFTFVLVNTEVIWIPAVQWRPGSPKDPWRNERLIL